MPWKNVSSMDQKQQFARLARSGRFTVTELCGQFGISRKTGHKWLARHAEGGMMALAARSRAPKSVTCRTAREVERLICTEKRLHSSWGPGKALEFSGFVAAALFREGPISLDEPE